MTVTTLRDIEACPRRWALTWADYPDLWNQRGYPPRLEMAAIGGSVLHHVLETLTRAFVRAGCSDVHDQSASTVLRDLGGYTKLVNASIDQVLKRYTGNVRASKHLEMATTSLRARVPELRAQAQVFLGRVKLSPHPKSVPYQAAHGTHRSPLRPGVYSELRFDAPTMKWKGTGDLLILSDEDCEILDFKTGAHDEGHSFQIRAYSVLWYRDYEINPTARRATKLTLVYNDANVSVAPLSESELVALERDLVERRQAAIEAARREPPRPLPGRENCGFCGVRHLCDAYWRPETLIKISESAQQSADFADVQISIRNSHGPLSWDGLVEGSGTLKHGSRVVLRTTESLPAFHSGESVRVLNARFTKEVDDPSQPAVLTMGRWSEAFIVTS